MKITSSQIKSIIPNCKNAEELSKIFNVLFPKYNINTVNRIAGFIAQCGHESMSFTVLQENLNYSAKALNVIFPKYFIRAGRDVEQYHRQPEKIANVVYANRMGNGDTASGDGWRYRGRGAIQLTGKNNYTAFAKYVNMSIIESIKYVETLQGAIESACWFWHTNDINKFCDRDDIVTMSKRINGGTIGLEDRKHHYEVAKDILNGSKKDYKELNINTNKLLKIGSTGETVKVLQEALGLQVDGVYGRVAATAVRLYQEENGLHADGIAGPVTLKSILG